MFINYKLLFITMLIMIMIKYITQIEKDILIKY